MSRPVRLLATVDCRSEHAGEERPVAVRLGGQPTPIVEVLEDAVAGPGTAGGEICRRLLVRLADGRALRLERPLPDGDWRVWAASGPEG